MTAIRTAPRTVRPPSPPDRADPGIPPAPLLDLPRLVACIRWRRHLWASLAVVGLILGMAVPLLLPSGMTAATRIFVVHDGISGGGEDPMKTDIAVLETSTVAGVAVEKLGIADRPQDFLRTYRGTSSAANILDITAQGRTVEDAITRLQAVADAFIENHVARSQDAATATVAALQMQRSELQTQLGRLDPLAARPGQPADPGASRQAIESQIDDLTRRAQTAALGAPQVAAGTRILDAPHSTSRPVLVSMALNGAMGLGLGLGLGLLFVLVMGVVSDRPLLRRDIAAHLGASVIAQVPTGRSNSARTERARVASQLVRLVRDAPRGVSFLEMGCARDAGQLVVSVVGELAEDRPVIVVDDLGSAAGAAELGGPDGRDVRVVGGAELEEPASAPESAGRIGLASVRPGTAWLDLPRLGSEALLVVKVGSVETAWLHTIARQLAELDTLVIGVVLVRPDPRDRTDGTLWDGLHLALRGRRPPAQVAPAGRGATNGHADLVSTGSATPDAPAAPRVEVERTETTAELDGADSAVADADDGANVTFVSMEARPLGAPAVASEPHQRDVTDGSAAGNHNGSTVLLVKAARQEPCLAAHQSEGAPRPSTTEENS